MPVIVVRTRVVELRTRASYELKVDLRGAAPDLLDPDVLDAVDVRGEVVVGDDDLDVLEGRVVPVSGAVEIGHKDLCMRVRDSRLLRLRRGTP
jgi:hypothetical protein